MSDAVLLDGKAVAQAELAKLQVRARALKEAGGAPLLASVRVGDSEDARLYSRAIARGMEKASLAYRPYEFSDTASPDEILARIRSLNSEDAVTAVLLFSPFPKKFSAFNLTEAVAISKDVEGRRILSGSSLRIAPPTAQAAVCLADSAARPLAGRQAVVVGRSDVVGKPAALLLLERHMTVTICHSKTVDLPAQVAKADVLIVSIGRPRFIQGDWIKPGAIVVDVGENMLDGQLVGDVDFESARKRAAFISPVPGGVGPVTNIMLLSNLVTIEERRLNNR